ncbi:IS3 family transposase [Corynebacterium macginleyi]|nr:IS3 family transposase [Corynebacterium macginleyi]
MMMLIARFTRSEKDSDEVYGAPRITAELAERYQISMNRKTVAKRMRLVGIML